MLDNFGYNRWVSSCCAKCGYQEKDCKCPDGYINLDGLLAGQALINYEPALNSITIPSNDDTPKAIPISEYHDDGIVLWWRLPVEEAPWVGSPDYDDWLDDYYTHWTKIEIPHE
jgi:hypothetical protein